MRIAIKASEQQKAEWMSRPVDAAATLIWVETDVPEADAYFDLSFEEWGAAFSGVNNKPVFAGSVLKTLAELPDNYSRINAWPGFVKNPALEVVLRNEAASDVLSQLGWQYNNVPDVVGMIAPRTISMIVNEAYFALGEEVSAKEDIDIAMKLGTNYPFGPFEWSGNIGLHRIYRLLQLLATTDARYRSAPALEQELKSIA